jgi:AraC-like DNA-binding protein
VRRALAQRLLADRTIAISEVAYLLGFFDASTFHRAFKRWTGATPAEYRNSVTSPISTR